LTDGLFLKIFREIAEKYADRGLVFEDMIVDNAAMQMVSKPQQFDIMVTPNLYGHICANIGGGLIGGAGLVPGCNLGSEICVFEPGARHIASDLKDKNSANPTSMLLSASWMLESLNLKDEAAKLRSAIYVTYRKRMHLTKDMQGSSTTSQFTDAILSEL
jgi:isocitrate dehydrogenase (NAD+)